MPVLNSEGEVIGVAEIMNKTDGTEAFTSHDEAVGTPTTIIFTFQAIKLPLLLLLLFYRLLPSVIIGCIVSSVIRNSYHVLRPLFSPILTRRPGLRKRAHPFTLPLKDDKQCIPRVLYRALLPPVQS